MPNRFLPIPSGTSPDQQIAMINKNFAELDAVSQSQLYFDPTTGLPIISIGTQSDGSSAIRVAKTGFDVTTAANAQLAFNSAQNVLKVVSSGTINVTNPSVSAPGGGGWASGSSSNSLAHGLGYTPIVLAFLQSGAYFYQLPLKLDVVISSTQVTFSTISISTNATNVQATYSTVASLPVGSSVSGGSTSTIKYYLLQETAS